MERSLDKDTELLIDAMRGIAALLVVFTHAFDLAVSETYGWNYANNPEAWRWARASFGHGGFLVWCFFMISGVCIHQSISRSIASGEFSFWRYAVARISRIYPLFILGLILAVLAWLLHEDFGEGYNEAPLREMAASLVSLQIFTTPFPAYETSWSLSCEMIYYTIWPVALLLMRGRVNWAAAFSLTSVLVMVCMIMLLWKGFHFFEHSAFFEGLWIVSVLLPVWVCGAWLAGHWGSAKLQISRRTWIASILLCILSECLLIVLKFKQYPHWAVHLAGWSSIPGLMLFLLGARFTHLSARSWAEPVCRWLGQFSYPCYILHMQLLLLLDHFVDIYGNGLAHRYPVLHAVFEFLIVLGVLVVVGPKLERWTMHWRKIWLSKLPKSGGNLTLKPV
ncbi:peptidoglycan/LPS O-acetylase OafA/YrhL [Prosthecobacter fusiformis]|uniref:Peptidoglycan/LPS O-acetylase OafA/YrhL n=1 Tax=Prosthecobacter fusiformis TaxID=48464 RepID=A0A4R7S6R8_9BACT|nr:acyltransferase [Prosthecobacter fusiformis]TDU73406.1 peptidoglycan/LPS O-acetylase OafA/YrhL [Prosthecobacter fusiformis]